MLAPRRIIMDKQAAYAMAALKRNNMDAYYVPAAADAADFAEGLMREGDTVAVGGSETLREIGLLDRLRSGKYRFLDRYAPGLDAEGIRRVFLESFGADVYLCSANAITLNGELYNVDGNGNRVAALCWGPRSVIVLAGCNKIVADVDAAIRYAKQVAAPANCVRLDRKTYCAGAGFCQGLAGGMTDGCRTEDRICCDYVVTGFQRTPGRIKVVLIGEDLGF